MNRRVQEPERERERINACTHTADTVPRTHTDTHAHTRAVCNCRQLVSYTQEGAPSPRKKGSQEGLCREHDSWAEPPGTSGYLPGRGGHGGIQAIKAREKRHKTPLTHLTDIYQMPPLAMVFTAMNLAQLQVLDAAAEDTDGVFAFRELTF